MAKKQVLEVDVNDFAQLISCVGYTITLVGLALPDGRQKDLALEMGDNLISLLLKYSSEEKQEFLEQASKEILTNEADTSVIN